MCHISWFEIFSYRIEPINIYIYKTTFNLPISSLLGTYLIKQMVWDHLGHGFFYRYYICRMQVFSAIGTDEIT